MGICTACLWRDSWPNKFLLSGGGDMQHQRWGESLAVSKLKEGACKRKRGVFTLEECHPGWVQERADYGLSQSLLSLSPGQGVKGGEEQRLAAKRRALLKNHQDREDEERKPYWPAHVRTRGLARGGL